MADINVERKRRSVWPWLLALLLIAAIGVAAWWWMGERAGRDIETEPAAEVETSPFGTTTPPPGGTDGTSAPPPTTTMQ